jgi:hypothetical protein
MTDTLLSVIDTINDKINHYRPQKRPKSAEKLLKMLFGGTSGLKIEYF